MLISEYFTLELYCCSTPVVTLETGGLEHREVVSLFCLRMGARPRCARLVAQCLRWPAAASDGRPATRVEGAAVKAS